MTATVSDSEQRARVRKAVAQPEVAPMAKADKAAMAEKMREELLAKLPDFAVCPKCKQSRPKSGPEGFGVRVAHDKATGLPSRASRQSYCKPCRRP